MVGETLGKKNQTKILVVYYNGNKLWTYLHNYYQIKIEQYNQLTDKYRHKKAQAYLRFYNRNPTEL